jgi:hypothetical protein
VFVQRIEYGMDKIALAHLDFTDTTVNHVHSQENG